MPASHHRKKHKEHLKQFRHTNDVTTPVSKERGNTTIIFTIIGILFGLAVGYFGGLSIYLLLIVAVIGAIAGYLIGKKMDSVK